MTVIPGEDMLGWRTVTTGHDLDGRATFRSDRSLSVDDSRGPVRIGRIMAVGVPALSVEDGEDQAERRDRFGDPLPGTGARRCADLEVHRGGHALTFCGSPCSWSSPKHGSLGAPSYIGVVQCERQESDPEIYNLS